MGVLEGSLLQDQHYLTFISDLESRARGKAAKSLKTDAGTEVLQVDLCKLDEGAAIWQRFSLYRHKSKGVKNHKDPALDIHGYGLNWPRLTEKGILQPWKITWWKHRISGKMQGKGMHCALIRKQSILQHICADLRWSCVWNTLCRSGYQISERASCSCKRCRGKATKKNKGSGIFALRKPPPPAAFQFEGQTTMWRSTEAYDQDTRRLEESMKLTGNILKTKSSYFSCNNPF